MMVKYRSPLMGWLCVWCEGREEYIQQLVSGNILDNYLLVNHKGAGE
jgi:hypothetical protein